MTAVHPVIAGFDSSPSSLDAALFAADLAVRRQVPLPEQGTSASTRP